MAEPQNPISVRVSLDGVKELYLIIVGIGITEALVHPRNLPDISHAAAYFILLAGYLVTIFRISLGIINMLGHVAEKVHQQWSELIALVCMSFVSCALGFFWMSINIDHLPLFLSATLLLLFSHWVTLFLSHKPWSFPRGWGLWMVGKGLAIIFAYPRGLYDPRRDRQHYWPMSEEQIRIKTTHYQWIRSDFWLAVMVGVLLWHASSGDGGVYALFPGLKTYLHRETSYQILLGLMFLGFGVWDFQVNRGYFFGDSGQSEGVNW